MGSFSQWRLFIINLKIFLFSVFSFLFSSILITLVCLRFLNLTTFLFSSGDPSVCLFPVTRVWFCSRRPECVSVPGVRSVVLFQETRVCLSSRKPECVSVPGDPNVVPYPETPGVFLYPETTGVFLYPETPGVFLYPETPGYFCPRKPECGSVPGSDANPL